MEDLNEEMFMMKSLILLAALTWVTFSYATPVAQEDMKDVESFKVERPVEERKREVAGIKKKKEVEKTTTEESETDSEVRYWQYSE